MTLKIKLLRDSQNKLTLIGIAKKYFQKTKTFDMVYT